ncbi:hypothetical protein CAI16_16460 [Virgibacillus dokdonensis]|uniref:3-octaprenyl-4-hydroxybenzoate carboxy-lyase n=1 Tax=Virgibacillus dokdonensis TaxID=302167 RepID=A0A3E0WLW3_9BACI|nr:UbiD family decarboxylase [Virgibacillus dokdonensis]RFA32956.1 hypothetical protein CAI16_16460 [Virgibacillus dokdonensis]
MEFRQFIQKLEEMGELKKISCEINPAVELGAINRRISDENGPALLFENVKGSNIPLVSNLLGTRKRIATYFSVDEDQLVEHYGQLSNFRNYIPQQVVSGTEAPCKEVKYFDNDVDLTKLPNPVWNEGDAGPYITFGVSRVKDPSGKISNLSVNRFQVKDKGSLGIWTDEGRDLGKILNMYWAQNKPCPIAITIGNSPSYLLASVDKAPFGVDEIMIAGALQKRPVLTTQCETSDIDVPIESEIVIEGEIPPGNFEEEGPFGEFLGYMGPKEKLPIVNVKAITMRENPIYLGSYEGFPMVEHHVMQSMHIENGLKLLSQFSGVQVVDVAVKPYSSGLSAVISINKKFDSDPKQVFFTAFMISILKDITVVDADINVRSEAELQWALATRFQADTDLTVVDGAQGLQLDPSAHGVKGHATAKKSAKLGIDATMSKEKHYPNRIKFSNETENLMNERWKEYGL